MSFWHLPGPQEVRVSVSGALLPHVPASRNLLSYSNQPCSSHEKESTTFRVQVPWWIISLETVGQLELTVTCWRLHAAARVLLTLRIAHCGLWRCVGCPQCARRGVPAPAPWLSVPQELSSGRLLYQHQQAETRTFSRRWTMHSFSVLGYLHFLLHSVLLEQISPHHL